MAYQKLELVEIQKMILEAKATRELEKEIEEELEEKDPTPEGAKASLEKHEIKKTEETEDDEVTTSS